MKELSIPEIVDLASAFYGSSVLFSAAELDVFKTIESLGPSADAEQVARETGCSLRGMRMLLNSAAAIGLLKKEGERFSNTAAGKAALVPGAPADLSNALFYNRDVYPMWGKLSDFVRNGEPVEAPSIHLGGDEERTRRFALSMRGRALAIGQAVTGMLDLGSCSRLLDLAGGPGTYAELLCRANPNLSCVTVDLPAISKVAAELIAEAGLEKRIECRAGDYHHDEYEACTYDAVTIFGALHQEAPESIVDILKRACRALKRGGRIFILDMMTDASGTTPAFSALFGLNMALNTDYGWVFSDAELKKWMSVAGFKPERTLVAPPPMPHWLVYGVKE